MTTLQILGFIGLGILLGGIIVLAKKRFETGITLMTIGAVVGMIGAIGRHFELDKDAHTALDVYRGKTTAGEWW